MIEDLMELGWHRNDPSNDKIIQEYHVDDETFHSRSDTDLRNLNFPFFFFLHRIISIIIVIDERFLER